MKTIITSLPVRDNDGETTYVARATFFALLRSAGVTFEVLPRCYGFWYDDDGTLYQDETVLVEMCGRDNAIRTALAVFGRDARQEAVLCVEKLDAEEHIVGRTLNGKAGAAALAKRYGGATLLPNGTAVSFRYAALNAGVEYAF